MIYYKLKVVHDEDGTLNFPPMRQNGKGYPREENNLGDDSSMCPPDDGDLRDTIIAENTNLINNNIPESIHSVLSYLHIGGAK